MPTVPEPSGSESTLAVRHWLERHKAGDTAARQELLDISMRRLRLLSRRILSDIPAVRSFEETDDLLQNSIVRLWKYLSSHQPETSVDYFRLAACLIRRELIDLSRFHFGQRHSHRQAESTASSLGDSLSPAVVPNNDDTFDPQKLSQWTEFQVQPGLLWVEAEATAVEEDGCFEVLTVSEATDSSLDGHDFAVHAFGNGVGDSVSAIAHDILQTLLD